MLDDKQVLKVGSGRFYTAEIDTERPTDLLNITEGTWDDMGHTSLEDILGSQSEGGEVTRHSSLQARNFRSSTAGRTDSFTVNLLQFGDDSLKLYYGENAEIFDNGDVGIPEVPVQVERAWLFLFFDGKTVGGIYAPRASFGRGEDFSIGTTEELSQLSVNVTPMASENNPGIPWRWIKPRQVEGADGGDGSST